MKITMQVQQPNLKLREMFDIFMKHCKVKNLSESTLEYYEYHCKNFICYFGNESLINTINDNIIEDYTLKLKEHNQSSISVNTSLRAVRAFLYLAMEKGYMSKFSISLIKAEKKIKETYTDYELKLILKKPDIKKCTFKEYRNWVIINYLLATGNRLSTVINIKTKDIDFANECITLQKTKSKRQQIMGHNQHLQLIIEHYVEKW
ncbi:MAG: phage integrase N-terminal SAM-like domain-containing protein [Clostridia bacterium]|nr:phage integrase N-terminal SAM-like domain-containing protein [Clostridia bacterium]